MYGKLEEVNSLILDGFPEKIDDLESEVNLELKPIQVDNHRKRVA